MLRKTRIVLAKAALTSGLTGAGRGHSWSAPRMVARKSVAPTFRGDITEEGCKLMATLGVVVNSLGNLEAVLSMATTLAKRHVDYGVKAADYAPVGVRCCRRWSRV